MRAAKSYLAPLAPADPIKGWYIAAPDAGATWTSTSLSFKGNNPLDRLAPRLVAHPSRAGVLMALATSALPLRSTDAGDSWLPSLSA